MKLLLPSLLLPAVPVAIFLVVVAVLAGRDGGGGGVVRRHEDEQEATRRMPARPVNDVLCQRSILLRKSLPLSC